jgi:glyoxylase-like metal-dependent hydrolase (beta-lactamase superfamily II)
MILDRRQFLVAGLAGAAMAQKPAAPLLDRGFARIDEIAPGVWATVADASKGDQCASNGGVIAGRDSVLIVEGHMQPAGAELEIEAAGMVSKAPVRGAVVTHFHLDHSFGNIAYARKKIAIIAHEKCGPMMKAQYGDMKGVDKEPLLAPLRKKIAAASDEIVKKRREGDLGAMQWMYAAVDAVTLAYPTETVGSSKRFDLGGLTAVIEYHPGHTPTDVIVRVPERDVVFAGDLLFNGMYPVCIDADMVAWRKVLDTFAGYGRRTRFVPGHGPVCGRENIADQSAVFDDLRAHAEKMQRTGADAEEAERRYVAPERFKSYAIYWGLGVGPAMRSYYAASGRRDRTAG